MHRRILRWTAPLLVVAALTAALPVESASFSVILVREGGSWRATCEQGCAWTEVSASKGGLFQGQQVMIDNVGIYTARTTPEETATFAFLVDTDGAQGWKATALKGSGWVEVHFGCPPSGTSCRARLTDAGVEGVK